MEEKGVPYQYKEVNPYKKEQHFLGQYGRVVEPRIPPSAYFVLSLLDINPKGLVPAVEYKNKALYESLIICEFIEDAYPEHGPSLLPKDPFERARARIWMDFVGKSVVPPV